MAIVVSQDVSSIEVPPLPDGGGRPPAASGEGPAAGREAAGSSRLESNDNNRNWIPSGKVYITPCRCRCRTCPGCGPRYGWKVRQRLLAKAALFTRPALLTFTVDRSTFGDARDAFLTITDGGFIRRLMRLLGVSLWAWTLEFQMKNGEGWPHWHLVVELPPGGLDLKRAWRLWRDKWGLGGLDLQRKENKTAEHAVFYVTKYLTKYPDAGFPQWVLELPRRIRWVGACKGIGPLVSDREVTAGDVPDSPDPDESLGREHRPLAMRMVECGQTLNFFREEMTLGAMRKVFLLRMPREIVEAASKGRHRMTIHSIEGEPSYLVGDWSTGKQLGDALMAAANDPPSKCDYRWSMRGRLQRISDAVAMTQKKGE